MKRISTIIHLLLKGEFKFIFKGIRKRLYSEINSFGLKRDLNINFKSPKALIDITIRCSKTTDDSHFEQEYSNSGLTEENILNCYVAVNKKESPCYRQWLMGSSQNSKIQSFFNNLFPVLKEDEALLEGAFTLPEFRGKRIMPAAMSIISEKGNGIGARYIITFVNINNIPSLKGCKRSGFSPYILRKEKWFFFKRNITYLTIPDELFQNYLLDTK
ncbi:MAG: GNAT family N-acetyltransferase [Flavobacteriaceae bacterium]|nr:MAG: GNAT family N-acetyltransferase [Flavobacteriaceae bacterium]